MRNLIILMSFPDSNSLAVADKGFPRHGALTKNWLDVKYLQSATVVAER